MNALAFDRETHTYRRGEDVVPGVTTILKAITSEQYAMVDPAVMDRAADLGKRVHRMIELDAANDLDEETLADDLVPYLGQWREFRATSGFEVRKTEARVYCEKHGYAGTLDLYGGLRGRHCIIDAKRCAAVPMSTGPQTAAYAEAAREQFGIASSYPIDRYALHMTPKGWKLVPFRDPGDLRVFLSCLTIHNFLQKTR